MVMPVAQRVSSEAPSSTSWAKTAMPFAVGLLVTVGVVAGVSRYLLPHALHQSITAPLYGSYAPEQLPVLARHPISEALHRLGGSLYMLLGVAQFSAGLRARRRALHRLVGKVFLALTLLAGASGAYMALAFPYERGETLPSVLFAALMVGFAMKSFVEIRRGNLAAHRAWMIRSFSIGLGIGTIRVLAVAVLNLTTLGARTIITPVFWLGWTLSLALAELWIRRSTLPATRAVS